MGVRDTEDRVEYRRGLVQALIEGTIFVGWSALVDPGSGEPLRDTRGRIIRLKNFRDAEQAMWLRVRSRIETTGNVESDGWLTVLDLERAIDKLASVDPTAAAVVTLVRDGFEIHELGKIVKTGRDSIGRVLARASVFLLAELNGKDGKRALEELEESS